MAVRDRLGHFVRGQASAKAAPAPAAPPDPAAKLVQTEARLAALDSERAKITDELAQHAAARQQWLGRGGNLGTAADLGEQDETLRQRLADIERERLDVAARAALLATQVRTAEWQTRLDKLLALEIAAADALDDYKSRLKELSHLRRETTGAGFGAELQRECTAPPAAPNALHPYTADLFYRMVRQRQARREGQQQPMQAAPTTPVTPAAAPWWTDLPSRAERFVPHPPPSGADVEALSGFERRWIRVLHDCDTSRINIGYDRLTAGVVMCLPVRRATLLVVQGFAEYCESPAPTESAATKEAAA